MFGSKMRFAWFVCAVVLAACAPKKQAQEVRLETVSTESWAVVKFAVEDEESIYDAHALVDLWALKEGEAWKCGVNAGGPEHRFFAIIQKDKMSSTGFVYGLLEMKGEVVTALSAGSFPTGPTDAVSLNLAGGQGRVLMMDMVSSERAEKIREEVPDLVVCEKKENALVPEKGK